MKPRLRVPHTWALLFGLVVAAAAATHLLPAGEYDRVEVEGRTVVDPGSYHPVEPRPATAGDVLLAFPRGLAATAEIVFYIFIIGGAFGVVEATGAIAAGIDAVVRACRGRGEIVVPALTVLFAVGGGTIGMAEETLPFLPGLVLLARRLGYDEITGGAIALVGAGAGFAGAPLNPFTVGVAHGIAGLPLFSGVGFRLAVWTVLTAIAVVYVSRYARRIRVAAPAGGARAEAARGPAAGGADRTGETGAEGAAGSGRGNRIGVRQALVLATLVAALAAVIAGALSWGWGILELSGLFLAVAIAAGLLGGLGADRTAEAFLAGATGIAAGALVVGLARGVLVVLEGTRSIDTVLHALAGAVESLPAWASAAGIYGVQVLLNYIVPSGSGQAALSIPILAPLADLVGVTRQTTVLAYQLGDGISNVFTPTQGYFMAGLALIGVPWTSWVRFMWRLELLWLAAGLLLVLAAHAAGYGPF